VLPPKGAGRRGAGAPPAAGDAGLTAKDRTLFDALKRRRSELARAQGVPAYVVFPDRSLLDMVRRRPQSPGDLRGVHGVGAAKLARYGDAFLEVIRQHPGG
jgi:ATP-dependent DNA helicase RecQ